MKEAFDKNDFQTPEPVCRYMASFVPVTVPAKTVLEPTPGKGNLAWALQKRTPYVLAPQDFFSVDESERFDYIVMNPPFLPRSLCHNIFTRCMKMSDNIIALVPYDVLTNSDSRSKAIAEFGLVSVTHLKRSTFPGIRVNTCILHMSRTKPSYKDTIYLSKIYGL